MIGQTDTFSSSSVDIEIGRLSYPPGNAIQTKIELAFRSMFVPSSLLNNWGVRIRCTAAVIGRVDAWFGNDGFGRFAPHVLVEEARTIGEPACAKSCIAVASHVSKNAWKSDAGDQQDMSVLAGRTSPFSSQGPTRDGHQKPEISAPGQYVTAALASGSELAVWGERAATSNGLLTVEFN
ncbi:MAG: S8 family serine peptidase [Isosphaerales bacterium]